MIQISRIMLPTDFSEPCWGAAQYACELARRFDAQLDLLHVAETPAIPMIAPGAPLPPELITDAEETARNELVQWHTSDFGELTNVTREVVRGTPSVEIVRYAKERNSDLIVLGTHGRSGLSHLLIGSVAERVVRKSRCPVLTVRPEAQPFESTLP